MMIRAFYGLTQDPFDHREIQLLPQQQEIHDTLKVHCQQGGLCLVLGFRFFEDVVTDMKFDCQSILSVVQLWGGLCTDFLGKPAPQKRIRDIPEWFGRFSSGPR